MLEDETLLDISPDLLVSVIQRDKLDVESEVDIYEAAMRWAKNKLSSDESLTLRDLLTPALKHIRFLTLTNEQFWTCSEIDNILTGNEITRLLKCINVAGTAPPEGFCAKTDMRAIGTAKVKTVGRNTLRSVASPTDWHSHLFCEYVFTKVHFMTSVDGVSVQTQIRPDNEHHNFYQEDISIFAFNLGRQKIANVTRYIGRVQYNSKLFIKLSAPVYGTQQSESTDLEIKVVFNKLGKYPHQIKKDTVTLGASFY